MTPIDRRLVEALKKSPYVEVTFELGYEKVTVPINGDKLFAHDVAIAVQGYINRQNSKKK